MFVQQKLDQDVNLSLRSLMDSSWCLSGLSHTGPEHLFLGFNHTTRENLYQQGLGRKALSSLCKEQLHCRDTLVHIWSRVWELAGNYNHKGIRDGATRQRQYKKSCQHPARCLGFALVSSPASRDAIFRPQFFVRNHYKQTTQKTKPWKLDAEEFQ